MKIIKWLQRPLNLSLSVILAGAGLLPLFFVAGANAAATGGQVQSRSIELSNSANAATGVSYKVSFTPVTTGTVNSLVVAFCSNDPIPGDSCTAPSGMDLGSSPTVSGQSGGTAGLTTTTNSTANVLKLSGTGTNTSGTAVSFTISGVTNPSAGTTTDTFYARILTYASAAGAGSWASGIPGTYVDYGGIALSTTQELNITAKVQEEITFCLDVSATPITDCSGSNNAVTLGDTHGVLSTSGAFVNNKAQYYVQTNAGGKAAIRMIGPTLSSGANTIPALATLTTSNPGRSQFGMCTFASSGTTANLAVSSNYNDGTGNCAATTNTAGTGATGGDHGAGFAFNSANTTSTYGDQIATESAGKYAVGTLAFLGNTSNTQVSGIYQTALNFIATGTY
ncbi:MAG: hypothetical protein ACREGA_04685 [Candidatus Saccharimonadales bacterium]